MKRIVSLFLTLVIVCSCMAASVFAAPESFRDVASDAYYHEAVLWAVQQGITAGVGENKFGPNNPCTRDQIMTMLWRAAGSPGHQTAESAFTDVSQGDYFYDAVLWAVENGVTAGVGNNKFGPSNPCTRAQIVTFLWKARGSQEPTNTANQFTDVASDAYYAKAVAWAVENKVTSGVGNNHFGPDETCTRAQIVTFLWKADQITPATPEPEPTEPPVAPTEPQPTEPQTTEPTTPAPTEPQPSEPAESCNHQWVIKNLAEHAHDMVNRGEDEFYWNTYYTATETNAKVCPKCGAFDESSCLNKYQGNAGSYEMLAMVNNLRQSVYGTTEYNLQIDDTLNQLAAIRAKEYSISHSHHGGTYTNAAENGSDSGTLKEHFNLWNNSHLHRENMLNKDYKYFGFGLETVTANTSSAIQLFWSEKMRDSYFM